MSYQPGRELDALVAEHVMDVNAHANSKMNPLPYYSTDIAAAWQVVEKLAKKEILFVIDNLMPGKSFRVTAHNIKRTEFFAYAETAPHAICLAALKAVGAI